VGHRAWFSLAGLLAAAGLITAAGFSAPAPRGGTLRFSSEADVDSVDPALAYLDTSWWLEYTTCATLYQYPDKPAPQGAIVTPEVATGFPNISPDGRTQTIQLKRTYRFHTGKPVTAANYVAAFNRDASPKLQSSALAAGYLNEIVGANAVIAGKAQTISGVKALASYTLRIRTTHPLADLPARLTMPFFCPIAPNTPRVEINDPLGSGPYYIASHIPNRQIVVQRNRFYRGPRPANVDRVVWTIGTGNQACLQAVEQNRIDYCVNRGFGPAADKQLAATYGINKPSGRLFFNPRPQTIYFAFNHDRPAFRVAGQIPLKQAINWALDRRALVEAAGFLVGKRTDQILSPPMLRDEHIYPLGGVTEQSLARARALLAKAKLRPKHLVLYSPIGARLPFEAWAQIFQFNLKRLGIDVEIKYFSFPTVGEKAGTRGEPYDVVVYAWSVDYADPITFFGPLLDGNNLTATRNLNLAYFDRPKYNREIERIDRLTGLARRKAWADLDGEMMRDDPPWAPFMNSAQEAFVSRSFGCYLFQPVVSYLDIGAACRK
jgi:peptide/nickel transport system substrate-binding protein/oligopeptide transport system substrate-binding protein